MSDEVLAASSPRNTSSHLEPDETTEVKHVEDLEAVVNEDIEPVAESKDEQVNEEGAQHSALKADHLHHGTQSHVVIQDNRDGTLSAKSSMHVPSKSMLKKTPKAKLSAYFLEESASQESLVSVMSFSSRSGMSLRGQDFFTKFGEVPTLEEVALMEDSSDDEDEDEELLWGRPSTVRSAYSQTVIPDKGSFVDPLSEKPLDDDDEPSTDEVGDGVDFGEEEVEEEETTTEDDELEDLYVQEFEEARKSDTEREEFLEALFRRATAANIVVDDIEFATNLQRQEHEYELQTITEQFMKGLINAVVEHCEIFDRNSMLRKNLDKMHLAQDIAAALSELSNAQKYRLFLNRKGVDFFRRRRTFRPITEDHPDTVAADIVKFKQSLNHLDLILSREQETRAIIQSQVADLKTEVALMETQADDTINQFEDIVRSTLLRETNEKSDRLKMVVDYLLRRKAVFRKEISKIRQQLIQRQHTSASLRKKLDVLEDLGNGLHMSDFEHLQTETFALGKKIEERNVELNKLRKRINADLHVRAHMRERHQMLRHSIVIQKCALQELIEDKNDDRAYLYQLKLERGKIRDEINELSFQGGLIDKPVLMMDYDQTVEKLEKTRGRVEMLRLKLSEAQVRESALLQRYSTQTSI